MTPWFSKIKKITENHANFQMHNLYAFTQVIYNMSF